MAKKEQLLKVLTSRDVAYILDMPPEDVYVLAVNGKLKASKQGRYWRFRLVDVLAYKRKHTGK